MQRLAGEPFWFCDWTGVVFIHFTVDPSRLKPQVPFSLDLYEGQAYVSLVAFTLRNLRPRVGGALARLAFRLFGTHRFLNVRTYVRSGSARGIYFLSEWLDAPRANLIAGPLLYGLPFRCGRLEYENDDGDLPIRGQVTDAGLSFGYRAKKGGSQELAEAGSADEFLVERYLAFTHRNGRDAWYPVWHPSWWITPLEAEIECRGLLEKTGDWWRTARYHSAHWSPSAGGVWMGWSRQLGEGET
jgi:uncharacterized protein YqjF (DUF2071 family)